ncbi:Coenzyme F390 synthetase-like protein [Paenibacillus curdlanolyticus YK9]|uniref:Coenzyme F390 synthetase-like protein n=1 Tax=Paenibacillus curdlanolyticus YK9 TaxID=717606 RepID=E0I5C0_9BACL|nr:AMP-binding protein [Paenibacillus curdlanolyticus]EFM12162.1 Coenzyme F390 synthetase-like protein [Paenibacillus curdlanolyticus YK9]
MISSPPSVEEKLQGLVQELVQHYPYYQALDRESLPFHELPLIDKRMINENREQFTRAMSEPTVESFTSGSTGIPFRCIKTVKEQAELSMAIQRQRLKWGLPMRYRSVLLGNSLYAEPRMVSSFAYQIERNAPHMIQGRCSALYLVACYMAEKGLNVPDSLRFVQNWGELIQPVQRQKIEEVFGVPLLDYYGMEELWLIAFTNKDKQLQINEQSVYMEVLDPLTGQPLPEGEAGDLVVTSFVMKSTPFVRYRTGDLGRLKRDAENNLILELLPFRGSQIILPDRSVSPSIFRYLDQFYKQLAEDSGMKQFQMVQETYTTFRLRIVADEVQDEVLHDAALKLETLLKQCLLTDQASIVIERVAAIPPHPVSGKFQPFVSMVS